MTGLDRPRIAAAVHAFLARHPHGRGPDRPPRHVATLQDRLTEDQCDLFEREPQHGRITAGSVDDARARKVARNG